MIFFLFKLFKIINENNLVCMQVYFFLKRKKKEKIREFYLFLKRIFFKRQFKVIVAIFINCNGFLFCLSYTHTLQFFFLSEKHTCTQIIRVFLLSIQKRIRYPTVKIKSKKPQYKICNETFKWRSDFMKICETENVFTENVSFNILIFFFFFWKSVLE